MSITSLDLARFLPAGLLFLRLVIAVIFVDSGWSDVKSPDDRAKSIGQSKTFTLCLGIAEILGGLGVGLGVLGQPAAAGLILVMLGAIGKKIFVWHISFWGGNSYGWHYDLMLIAMNLIVLFTNGGPYVVTKL
jgi:putative oxidoreductase